MGKNRESDLLQLFISKMEKQDLYPAMIEAFAYYFKKLVKGETGLLTESEIEPVLPEELITTGDIKEYSSAGRDRLKNTAIIKLNGGLGTSMGLTGPKSLLHIKEDQSFLQTILNQAEHSGAKLILMNSFSTNESTVKAVSDIKPKIEPVMFIQHKIPKILKETLKPACCPEDPDLEWNPPGHGDIYSALYSTGILETLLKQNIKYAFISNADNLGATLDDSLLGYFSEKNIPFMMEVTKRTPSDRKGGHLARKKNGGLILRESAQCPEEENDFFQDINRYGYFNTNNIWVNLENLDKFIKDRKTAGKTFYLPMIRNQKTLDPRDKQSPEIFQIETAMGAAIAELAGAVAIDVPRTRFLPVKTCNDLLIARSDRFILQKDGRLARNPDNKTKHIKIDLDPEYYSMIHDFDRRFANGAPSLLECESLTINGDVFFEKDVKIKGNVCITNNSNKAVTIKQAQIIETTMSF